MEKQTTKRVSFLTLPFLILFSFALNTSFARDKNEVVKAETNTGLASWYGPKFHGKKTATGEVYNQHGLSCASNKYPLGTLLRVTNMKNGKTVVVKVNDRMHPKVKRSVDLSKAAAQELNMIKTGVTTVQIEVITPTVL
ncbi:septal ring lytic transglycosylase RlpA family protein [Polluticaenibacter yanchengensis]|uniref:Probable endolytic peptidoglycan transglycosylase RlpA n=1 Tax=Polluticaenibacter yanchengensis TaxID=3014562 RepID=A0ABT4ULJ7_9BACT|nr:septal ring lytic transglycosylase RlpA family protein [Chitinophagaceae bacterium LY-5]